MCASSDAAAKSPSCKDTYDRPRKHRPGEDDCPVPCRYLGAHGVPPRQKDQCGPSHGWEESPPVADYKPNYKADSEDYEKSHHLGLSAFRPFAVTPIRARLVLGLRRADAS